MNTSPAKFSTRSAGFWCRCFLAAGLAILSTSCTTYRRAVPAPAEQKTSATRQPPTQRPYMVDGKLYQPLDTHEGFEQEGLASSYGAEFHGRKTSNGETFDMAAMTAAHKTLPMNVYVRVRNKRNGREVVVRINDRGPFVNDRVIDLSEAAAKQLGMLQEGVVPVRLAALGYRTGEAGANGGYRQPASYDAGTYTLQVGAFTVRANAVRYAGELGRSYGTADVQEAVVKGTTYYRVRVERYRSLRAAQAGQERFERLGFSGCFVVAVD